MVKLFPAIIIAYILFNFIYYYIKYMNPHKLIMIFGKKGSGKTTYMVKLAYKYSKKGRPVFSNVDIPNTYHFDDSDIGRFGFPENSVILVDEVGMIWDNRDFKNFQNYVRDYFKLQRHYKHTVYLFSQSFDIDKKLRDLTDQMYLITNFMNCMSVLRRINKKVGIVETSNGESKLTDQYVFDSLLFFWCGSIQFTWLPNWIGMYNSFESPQLEFKDYKLLEGKIERNNIIRRCKSLFNWLLCRFGFSKEDFEAINSPDPDTEQPEAESSGSWADLNF